MSNPYDRNPFGLPPPWNPGYALPQNVDDEGLERRTFTTAWSPRGTFDEPKVGDGGYALPKYVEQEGYGRGAAITKWAPRGTYAGPRVKHWLDQPASKLVGTTKLPGGATKMKIAAMAGVEMQQTGDAPFSSYGVTAARALIETVKMMPPDLRAKQMKAALGRIDPKLYARGEQYATAEAKVGVPADVALERGLAVAMSHGIATELVDLGKGKMPAKKTQLGCCMGLGDYPPVRAGYCWVPATPTVAGHWVRASASGCAYPQDAATAGSTVVRTGGAGVTVTDSSGNVVQTKLSAPPVSQPSDQKFVNIGPFLIPTNVGAYRDHRALTDDKKAFVDANIAIAAKAGGVSTAEMKTGKYPFVRFKVDGSDWGLFYQEKDGDTVVAYHKIAPSMLSAYESLGFGLSSITGAVTDTVSSIAGGLKDAAEWVGGAIASVFKKIWAGIKWVAAKVVDFVKDAAEWIKDKACDLFTSPVGQMAGAAAGAAVGGPAGAQAGAMGAQVAAQACSSPAAAPVAAPAAAQGSNLMPVLLIGGAGLAAVLLLGGKKK